MLAVAALRQGASGQVNLPMKRSRHCCRSGWEGDICIIFMAAKGKAIIFYRCFLFRQHRWKTCHGISTKLGQ